MTYTDLLYQLALTRVPNIGHVQAKTLTEYFGSAAAVFKASQQQLERVEGVGTIRARSIKEFRNFSEAEKEIEFIRKYGIQPLHFTDKDYPKRLLNCYDPPTLLFYKGNTSLNASRLVAIVGTRNNTEYGKSFTEKLVKSLAELDCVVVSGLAFGIDAVAHKCAVKLQIPTIGVVGHGLDTIYPGEHASLAKQMLKNGGILTEFPSRTKPDKYNFPSRNRVVAGITDATIIVESGIKGGSIITAEMASDYHRDVFAVPGRAIDAKSAGCNELIRNNRAAMLTDPEQFGEAMGWTLSKKAEKTVQKEMFIELNEEEKKIMETLRNHGHVNIDDLKFQLGMSNSTLAAILLQLEMQGLLKVLPGNQYALTD